MLIPPFLVLEPVKMVHHLREGRSMFGLVRARVSYRVGARWRGAYRLVSAQTAKATGDSPNRVCLL